MHDSAVDVLIDTKDAYRFSPERDRLFFDAMRESFHHHFKNCSLYKKLCYLDGFSPELFRDFNDIYYIPHFFVTVLKLYELTSIPREEVEMVLTSSGTTGQKSAVSLDRTTLDRIHRIVWNIYESYGMAHRKTASNCLLFSYEYEHAKNIGTAFSDKLLSGLTPVKSVAYALKKDPHNGRFYLDTAGVIETLREFSADGSPLRIIGFPAFLYDVWEYYREKKLPDMNFGKESFIIIGGGWKDRGDKEIPKREFKEKISKWLGMPPENIRDLYGLVEHGVPYCECEEGNLHVPIYSRAISRDPETMRILPDGQIGLLHLYAPYLNSFPAISLLTTDLGTTGSNCPCGRNAPYIKMLGRGGTRKHKGCAIQALENVKAV